MTNRSRSLFPGGAPSPSDAVAALYGPGNEAVARAVVGSLERRIFGGAPPVPSGFIRRSLARLALAVMRRTTGTETRTGPDGKPVVVRRNRILENSGHPYAATLLEPTRADTASFVEGGDPMNTIYMMIAPEIAARGGRWDAIMLDSVQARDVQWRLVWEVRFTYELAAARLRAGQPVRLKAVAAGTGLCLILVVEHLIAEGYDPAMISATISDREAANIEKALRLIEKLPGTSKHLALHTGSPSGIFLQIEDVLRPSTKTANDALYDVVTVVGLLEYFPGFTSTTTEELAGEVAPDQPPFAAEVVRNIAAMLVPSGHLVANSFRLQAAVHIMEVFGKKFRYRGRGEMAALLATGGFAPTGKYVSGNVFDVEVFAKRGA